MPDIREHPTATAAGTFDIGGELAAHRMGFGAMRLTGPGVWGEPREMPHLANIPAGRPPVRRTGIGGSA